VERRWALVVVGLLLAALFGVGLWRMTTARRPASGEQGKEPDCHSYSQIRVGMQEKDVQAVIGCSYGWHKSTPAPLSTAIGVSSPDGFHSWGWLFDDCEIWVFFSGDGEVVHKEIAIR
jgi:hypothetical protein